MEVSFGFRDDSFFLVFWDLFYCFKNVEVEVVWDFFVICLCWGLCKGCFFEISLVVLGVEISLVGVCMCVCLCEYVCVCVDVCVFEVLCGCVCFYVFGCVISGCGCWVCFYVGCLYVYFLWLKWLCI